MSSVSRPAALSAIAATRPAGPPPITATAAVSSLPTSITGVFRCCEVRVIYDRKSANDRDIAALRDAARLAGKATVRVKVTAMERIESPEKATTAHIAAAFAVHVFTACGGACALLALLA